MLLDITFMDDITRPLAPKLPELTEAQKGGGRHLKYVHDHLRANVVQLTRLIASIELGEISAQEALDQTKTMDMIQNYRRFGNLCGRFCQTVNTHHSIEDAHLFPALSAKGEAWKKVIDRLEAEHVVVHELLVRLIDMLNLLIESPIPENFAQARLVNEKLNEVLLSHLGYEEDEIGDALGYFGILD